MTAFVLVSLGVILVPGQSTFFILATGAAHGRRSALLAAGGIELAAALRVLATAAGLAGLVAASPPAFACVRWAGAIALVWLGVRSLGATRMRPDAGTARTGFVVGLTNAQMVLFSVSFLPQFAGPDPSRLLMLGGVFWGVATVWDVAFAWASGSIGDWVRAHPRALAAMPRIEGVAFLALAGWAAF